MGIQYRFPFLYKLLIRGIHTSRLINTFKGEVGKNNKIFDVGAGFGLSAEYMDPSNTYYGIDLNERFVNYGQRLGRNIELRDIFDPKAYKNSDIFMLIDMIHHLPIKKLKVLFDLIFEHAEKKVIIMEPNFQSTETANVVDRFWKMLMIKFDNDGINKIKRWLTKAEYNELFERRFGTNSGSKFKLRIQEIGYYYLVVFTKK